MSRSHSVRPEALSIRNPDGYWINTQGFSEVANHYRKYKRYCDEEPDSSAYIDFWEAERIKCLKGVSIGGAHITGDHYFELNYCPLQVTKLTGRGAENVVDLPLFYDGDHDYFWYCDIARWGADQEFVDGLHLPSTIGNLNGNLHIVLAKARQKGFTAKAAARGVNNFFHKPRSVSVFAIQERKYEKIMTEANYFIGHVNSTTGWKKNLDYKNTADYKRASYKEFVGGTPIEKGYMSEVRLVLLKDNPQALRSITGELVVIDEAGQVIWLRKVVDSGIPGLMSGEYATGQMVVQGTGGYNAEAIHIFSEFFYNARQEGFLYVENNYDEDVIGTSGVFFGQQINKQGYMDAQGNSLVKEAYESEVKKREALRFEPGGMDKVKSLMAEYALNPAEMFIRLGDSTLPTILIKNRIQKVMTNPAIGAAWMPYTLTRYKGKEDAGWKVKAEIDLDGKTKPLLKFGERVDPAIGKYGAVLIKEKPDPDFEYYIGCDPYAHDDGTSHGVIYVMKAANAYSFNHDTIVASYVGRPKRIDEFNKILADMAIYYNAKILFENMTRSVEPYFTRTKLLEYLCVQPDAAIGEVHKKSKVKRPWGMHVTTELKASGIEYVNDYIQEDRDYDIEGVTINLDTIDDIGLLQEMLYYNKKDNFDRFDAFVQCMFHRNQRAIGKEVRGDNEKKATFIDRWYARMDDLKAERAMGYK